jgi:hypothetical protein
MALKLLHRSNLLLALNSYHTVLPFLRTAPLRTRSQCCPPILAFCNQRLFIYAYNILKPPILSPSITTLSLSAFVPFCCTVANTRSSWGETGFDFVRSAQRVVALRRKVALACRRSYRSV